MPATDAAIDDHIRSLVSEKLDVPEAKVWPQAHLESDLGADRLDVVALFMAIERDFAIRIPNEHFADLKTLGDVTRYVRRRAAAGCDGPEPGEVTS